MLSNQTGQLFMSCHLATFMLRYWAMFYVVVLANFNVKVLNNLFYLGFGQQPLKIFGKPLYNGIGKPLMLDNQTGQPFMSCHWAHLMRFWAIVYLMVLANIVIVNVMFNTLFSIYLDMD